jgi:hypothetical protein
MSANGFFAWGVDGTDVVAARPESKSKSLSKSGSKWASTLDTAKSVLDPDPDPDSDSDGEPLDVPGTMVTSLMAVVVGGR